MSRYNCTLGGIQVDRGTSQRGDIRRGSHFTAATHTGVLSTTASVSHAVFPRV